MIFFAMMAPVYVSTNALLPLSGTTNAPLAAETMRCDAAKN